MIKSGEAALIMEICQRRNFTSDGELIMDKKAQRILMRYMDDIKRESLTAGEIVYAKERGAILDDLFISCEQAVSVLSKIFEAVSLADAAEAFLYSLSTRDMEYRYVLASYVYAASWLKFDKGRTDGVPQPLSRTFYNWVKYRGGGIWGEIGKPIHYLSDFASAEKRNAAHSDRRILHEIISCALSMEDGATGSMLCRKVAESKVLPCNKSEAVGLMETLAVCGILETPERRGYLDVFTPPLSRDTGDLRQSLSYPLNWWRGEHKVNCENLRRVFGSDIF